MFSSKIFCQHIALFVVLKIAFMFTKSSSPLQNLQNVNLEKGS